MSLSISLAFLACTSLIVAVVHISCHGDTLVGSWEFISVYCALASP